MERQPSIPQKRVTPFEDDLSRDIKKPATPTSNVQSPMATEEGWIYPTETSQKTTEETTQSTEANHQTLGPYDLPPDLQEYMGMTLDQVDQNINDIYESPWIEPMPDISGITEQMDTTPDKEPKRAGPEITDSSQTVMARAQSDEETSTSQTSEGGGSYPILITRTKRTQTAASRMKGCSLKSLETYNKAFKQYKARLVGRILDDKETIHVYLNGLNLGVLKELRTQKQ
jgi:hypothetical protein